MFEGKTINICMIILRIVLRQFLACVILYSTALPISAIGATPTCQALFRTSAGSGSSKVVQAWQPVVDLELPNFIKSYLHLTPYFKARAEFTDQGAGVTFVIPSLSPDWNGFSGEWIQSHFIVKVLAEVLPKARFLSSMEDGSSGQVKFEVIDLAETGQKPNAKLVDMAKLKSANPTTAGLDHLRTRDELGIFEGERVLSLYVQGATFGPLTKSDSEFAIMAGLVRKLKTQTLLVTMAGAQESLLPFKHLLESELGRKVRILKLSQLTRRSIAQAHSNGFIALVENDLKGYTPYFHSAADLSLVIGPINIFESLNVGTPTLVYHELNSELTAMVYGHYETTFSRMVRQADKTGYAYRSDNIVDLIAAGAKFVDGGRVPEDRRPFLLKSGKIDSPFDRLLKELESQTLEQLSIEKLDR